ncbi:hypothetical protein DDW44_00275 [Streptomyces tirandamycinicus]|uniref:Uncharacterized protein n=1 Tax=Streptomyces tirandamycinicus TaxID=2174846 RepID=A0A2S1SLW1_9ACTN|nr:hypothetical protein DDW44_00275 [Streptomyces tirandamycinicus]
MGVPPEDRRGQGRAGQGRGGRGREGRGRGAPGIGRWGTPGPRGPVVGEEAVRPVRPGSRGPGRRPAAPAGG